MIIITASLSFTVWMDDTRPGHSCLFVCLIHYSAFFGSEGHVALDRNLGPGYDTLLLQMIPGDLLSAFPHRQFHTLPGLLDSWAALPNSNPNACMPMQGGSLYHFYDGLWYDPAKRRTHDLPCERRTLYRLSQPDMVRVIAKTSCVNTQIDPHKVKCTCTVSRTS